MLLNVHLDDLAAPPVNVGNFASWGLRSPFFLSWSHTGAAGFVAYGSGFASVVLMVRLAEC